MDNLYKVFSAITSLSDTTNVECLVDTGASHHCVNNKQHFVNFDQNFTKHNSYLELADGSKKSNLILAKGTVKLPLYDVMGTLRHVTLYNALYTPTFTRNILSFKQAVQFNSKFDLNTIGQETMTTPDGYIFRIHSTGNLYTLHTFQANAIISRSATSWHSIFGHMNMDYIHKMPDIMDNMKIVKCNVKEICQPCILSKMKRTFNRVHDTRAELPFQHIYCDLNILPLDDECPYKYVFGAIDDYSGYLAIILLKTKADTHKALKHFLAHHVTFGDIKLIRTDQGTEFTSDAFQSILLDKCIKFEMSAPYTPHQNARIERAWQTLFNRARAIQIESKASPHLRQYILKYATFLINRSYSEPIKMTPYQAVHNKRPNAIEMQLFGSLIYGYQHHVHKQKWDPRALPGMFIGYDPLSTAKLIYFPNENNIRKVKDVRFTDKLFYKCNNSEKGDPTCPPTSIMSQHPSVTDSPHSTPDLESRPPTPESRSLSRRDLHSSADIEQISKTTHSSSRGHLKSYSQRPQRHRAQTDFYGVQNNEDNEYDDEFHNNVINMYKICNLNNVPNNPNSYVEAINSPEREHWIRAMELEMTSLLTNNTFDLVKLPPATKAIGGRWVFAIKCSPSGDRKYKARFVAKGFSQRPGINFDETYAPTVRMPTLRMLYEISAQLSLIIHHCDVNNAFLNSNLDTPIFMKQPEGFVKDQTLVCRLKKSIYGLKQSGMLWNATLSNFMCSQNLTQSDRDHCLYIRIDVQGKLLVLFWVDDIICAGSNMHIVNTFKENLGKQFKIKDLGPLQWFLGIQFNQNEQYYAMNQTLYTNQILARFDMTECRPRSLPCEPGVHKLLLNESPLYDNPTCYREIVGSLIYLSTCTRPDISFVVSLLSKFMAVPKLIHMKIARGVLRYLKYSINYDLKYVKSKEPSKLYGFTDSDFAQSADSRSISGYCFKMNNNSALISWGSQKQSLVALSTVEAEYIAATQALKEAIFLRLLYANFTNQLPQTVPLYCDNQGAIALAGHASYHKRTKHIAVQYHAIRTYIKDKTIHMSYIPSNQNLADLFTKALNGSKLKSFAIVRGKVNDY